MRTKIQTCVCRRCYVEKPHTQEYFYSHGPIVDGKKIYRHYICIVCQRELAYYYRKIRQAIARVDRYERKSIKKIKAEVDKEIRQNLRYRKVMSIEEEKLLIKHINESHREAIKENIRIDKQKIKALKKIAYIEREKVRKTSPEYRAAQRNRYYVRKDRKLKEATHNPLPRISPSDSSILEWTPENVPFGHLRYI